MLRFWGRRLSSSIWAGLWRPTQSVPFIFVCQNPLNGDVPVSSSHESGSVFYSFPFTFTHPHFHLPQRGFASESLTPKGENNIVPQVPSTVAAVKNPSSKIVYDEYNHERYTPGDPGKRAFAYLLLTGGRFVYASLIHLLILQFVLSMSASKDVLALAYLEVDLSNIEPGTTVTVKWRGKPVFIRHEEGIKLANSVDVRSLRDPQEDFERVKNPEWLAVVGVCTHLVVSLYQMLVILVGGFAPAMVRIMTSLVVLEKALLSTTWKYLLIHFWMRTIY